MSKLKSLIWHWKMIFRNDKKMGSYVPFGYILKKLKQLEISEYPLAYN
jgi:hypothetical protein